MKVADVYSHLNGLEYLLVQKPALWEEVCSVISMVNCPPARTRRANRTAKELNSCSFVSNRVASDFSNLFQRRNWDNLSKRFEDTRFVEREQARPTLQTRTMRVSSDNQIDFVKDRVAIEVRFGKYAFVAYDLFVKHLAFYVRDQIDVGIEILPMKVLQAEMSSGPGYYEGELYNVIRNGRGVPAVPLVMIGVAP